MPKLDQNAGNETEPDFEDNQEPEAVVEAPADSQSSTTPMSPEEQEEHDAEAAGVNIDEKAEKKIRNTELKALKKDLKELGTLYGGGKTSMINVAERVTQAAMKKAVSLADAENIYDLFHNAAEAKATIDDAGVVPDAAVEEKPLSKDAAENKKQQVRKFEQFIELGNKFDETAEDLIRRARNIHLKALAGNRDTVKPGSTYTILVAIARANKTRKESQGVMSDQEINDYLYVAPKPENAQADEWKKVEQAIDAVQAALRGGRGDNARAPIEAHTVPGQHLLRALEELRQALGAGAPERLDALDKAESDRAQKLDEANALKATKGKRKKAA